jgi:predicted DNA-binding protein (MmcQ/YjbR family)
MREVCLKLPETAEEEHFGEVCFLVGTRIFASCGEKAGVCRIIFQHEPEHARRLVDSDTRFQPYARQKNCVWMNADAVWDWEEVRGLVLESYRLNASGKRAPKKGRVPARRKRPKNK